jgi:choline dehydrogenase
LSSFLLKPLSRGTVMIDTTDQSANPAMGFRAATDPADWELAIALVRKLREIVKGPSMLILEPAENAPFGASVTFQ